MVEQPLNGKDKNFSPVQQSERTRENLHSAIAELVKAACRHPKESPQRQRHLTQIISLISASNLLYRDYIPGYEDALQQTWLYFCQNLCEATTANQPYDPNKSQITTWLNAYLKNRLLDLRLADQKEQQRRVTTQDEQYDVTENIEAPPDIPPLLEQVQQWVEKDASGELRQIHIRGRAELTAQVLILRRLPPEQSWQELSEEFEVPISTLSSFYQRQCAPCLRRFGKEIGYL